MKSLLALLVLIAPAAAWADGSVALEGGLLGGPIVYDGPNGTGTGNIRVSDIVAAPSLSLGLTIAGRVSDRLSIGVAGDATLALGGRQQLTTFSAFNFFGQVGGFLDVTVRRGSRPLLQFGAGWAASRFVGGSTDVGAATNVEVLRALSGPIIRAAPSKRYESFSLGIEARIAVQRGGDVTFVLITLLAASTSAAPGRGNQSPVTPED